MIFSFFFFFLMFGGYNPILLSIFTTVCISSPELIYLQVASLYPQTASLQFLQI